VIGGERGHAMNESEDGDKVLEEMRKRGYG